MAMGRVRDAKDSNSSFLQAGGQGRQVEVRQVEGEVGKGVAGITEVGR